MLKRIRLRSSPPNITDGHVVHVRNTTEFGVTDYHRGTGYRAEGILEANSLLVSNKTSCEGTRPAVCSQLCDKLPGGNVKTGR